MAREAGEMASEASLMASFVNVRVVRLSGGHLCLQMCPSSTFGHVKEQVLAHWSISVLCQNLAVGATPVDDVMMLSEFMDAATPELSISLVVSKSQATKDLETNTGADKQLHALLKLKQGGNRVVGEAERHAAIGRLAAQHVHVRSSALGLLSQCARRAEGDETMIAAITRCLRDDEAYIRKQAISILGDLSVGRDHRILAAILENVGDPHHLVRKEAVSVLCKIDDQGDETVFDAVRERLVDAKLAVRRAAVQAMERFAQNGNPRAHREIAAFLQDENKDIKAEAARALAAMSQGAPGKNASDRGACRSKGQAARVAKGYGRSCGKTVWATAVAV